MKINTVLTEMDIGVSNIEIEGEVVYTDQPERKIGEGKQGHYDFWSQWIVIQDDTGKIGCSVSLDKEEYKLDKGVVARVKGKLKEWKGKRKIEGKLIAISKGDRVTDVQQEVAEEYFEEKGKEAKEEKVVPIKAEPVKAVTKPDNNVWEEKDLRIARECAVKAVTELVCKGVMEGKSFFSFANTIVKYIYNGKVVNGILRNNREPLEIIDEDAAFPDEVRKEIEKAVDKAEEEEQGNSYNNALPFTGKKKALKTISKAEDFIPPDKMPD